MEDILELLVCGEDAGIRIDAYLSVKTEFTRSRIAAMIQEGAVTADGKMITKPSVKTASGQKIALLSPRVKEVAIEPQNIPIDILYQDSDIAVVVKPAGMVVHPAAGNPDGTLVNALLFHLDNLSGIGGEMRPGIVHRLDKDTSGVMLVAKNDMAHQSLSDQLANRTMEKHYRAVVMGKMKTETGRIEKAIDRDQNDRKKMAIDPLGRMAITEWTVLKEYSDKSLLDVHILTGRTHQIRVHMRSLGHPVLGDPIYGYNKMPHAKRLMLHAYSIAFDHPATGERMTFTAPCPFAEE